MKSLVELHEVLLADAGRKCGAPVWRSIQTLRQRVKHEGDSFLTITLPAFCQDFERGLDRGWIAPGDFPNFRKKKGSSGTPAFLSEFLCSVFDSEGHLLSEPSIVCILCVRQICLFAKKILRPCDERRQKDAIEAYAQCDCEVNSSLPDSQLGRYFGYVSDIVTKALGVDSLERENLRPRHGPGATREGIFGNQKYVHRVWHERLEAVGFNYLLYGHGSDTVDHWDLGPNTWPMLLDPETEQPSRVVLVPKTMKTPRVIAIEPVCMQYIQQALSRFLVDSVENCHLTRHRVNFRDQGVNQRRALHSSVTRQLATLDMKDASDRVSMCHVERLFSACPDFLDMVKACRSTRTELPSGEVLTLSKFASMGSALCFPVESLVFFVSIIASRICRAGDFPTLSTVSRYAKSVYVYGDDLIVPSDEAPSICDDLESLGFRVNRRKSFWTGQFRESCGSDCYGGQKVTPVYLRRDLPTSRGEVSELLSTVSTANQLFRAGFYRTALLLRDEVEDLLGPLPQVTEESSAIGWYDFSDSRPVRRWNRNLQRGEIRAWVPFTPKQSDPLTGRSAMVKCLLQGGQEIVSSAVDHLESSPSRFRLALKRRWVPAP